MRGIALLRPYLGVVKYFAEHEVEPNITAEELATAEEEHDLAQQELDHGFPLLHEQASVAFWSSLESLVNSLVASLLANCPDAWQAGHIARLRVRVGDYETLNQADRCFWVADLLGTC
jgi:hypothetical protein